MRALWIPMFSMRSYETGQYSILKDGNFQLIMARVLASNFDENIVAVPRDSSDYHEFIKTVEGIPNLTILALNYGMNAVETREKFWSLNPYLFELEANYDIVIADQVNSYPGTKPVIYNFNISKIPELDRPYVDQFFERELESISKSVFATVINPRQREYILEVRPDLADKVFVNTKVAHEDRLPKVEHKLVDDSCWHKMIFWPFRISDKAYQFEQFCTAFKEQKLDEDGFFIVCTDPNDTLPKKLPHWIHPVTLDKKSYYWYLAAKPFVVMLDDIDLVLHPGTVEFMHYKCKLITYEANLYECPNAIKNLDQLSSALHYPVYNVMDSERFRFIYKHGEIDAYYNKDFVNDRT